MTAAPRDRWARKFRVLVTLGESTTAGAWRSARQRCWASRLAAPIRDVQAQPVRLVNAGLGANVISRRGPAYAHSGKPAALERLDRHAIAHDLDLLRRYNRATEAVAAGRDCLFVDLLAGYGNAPWLVHHDGVHANDLGHLVVAHRIFETLARSGPGLALHTRQLERTAPRWRDESTLKSDDGH